MTNPLKIYSGSNALLYTTPVNIGCRRRVQLMNEDSITVKFSDKTKMKFPVGTRIGDFYITKEQQEKYNATTGGYDYELKFDAYYWLWANRLLFYVMPGVTNAPKETSFKLTATIDVHAAVILRALNALGFTYDGSPFRVDTDAGFSTEAKYISYANMSILGGIQAIADAYECEWWVVGNSIHFGKCNAIGEYDFTVGENVASITSDAKTTPANRLVVFGSTRNLPPNYRTPESSDVVDAVVVKRLMLPEGTPYLQTSPDIPEDEIVEEEVVLDSVYPRTSLSVTDVTTYDSTSEGITQTFYRVKYGTAFHFSKDYILPDEELHVVFESGDLNGMDFAVKFNPLGLAEKKDDGSFNPDAQMFEIVANEDYGRSLPDAVLHPSKTDKFSLYGWDATKMEALGLLAAAEQELLTEGNKLLDEYRKDKQTYTCPMMWDWCKEQAEEGNSPRLGSVVNLHFVAGDTGRKSRIIGFEHDLDIEYSNVTYTCGEKVSVSRLKTLESKVEGLTHDGTKVKVQNSLDFLSKRYSDRTPYQLASDVGFDVGQFLASVSGGRFAIDKVTGQSFLEVDRIFARVRAYFESLTVVERESLAGEQMVTPGGGVKCTSVEEVRDGQNVLTGWRCYFLSEQDGEKRETKIIVGDQAIAQTFNAKVGTTNKVSNHRWWRLVTGVSNNAYTDDSGNVYGYIEVSATDCETDSDTPKEGDDVIQFGNRIDKTRQAAILISTVATDAPSIKLLTGIDHYSLVGKDIISQGYDAAKGHAYFRCYGDTYIGAPDGSTYVKFDLDANKTTVKADLEIGSTIGGKGISQFVSDLIPEIPELTQEDIEDYVNNIVNPKIEGIQDQIDGVIETWFYNGVPTLSNYPASEWNTDALKAQHLGDLYYDNDTGTAYRFSQKADKSYYWNVITDDAITKALAAAQKAQDTADGKRRTFTSQPAPPYDKGDIWVNATYPAGNTVKDAANGKYVNDILRCNTSRATGSFAIGDWGLASNYTDDTAALAAAQAAKAAKDAADAAQSAANAAQSSVTSLNNYVDGAFKDGIIDETEASGIANYINIVNADKERIDGTYQTLYANAYLSATGKAALKTAHDDVATKITALINAINSAIADNKVTAAESAAVDSAFSAFSTSNKAFSAAVETANAEIQKTLKSAADAAKTAADNAKATADNAQSVADAAKDRLDSWAADGVISPTEKQAIKDEIARIKGEKADIAAQYTKYGGTTPQAYLDAYTAYYNQLVDLSASTPENITIPATFASNQTQYYTQRTVCVKAIADLASAYADKVAKEEAAKATDPFKYLRESLLNAQQESTEISGGLILSTMMALGYTENGVKKILSGMNGSYVSSLGGRTIASWYGGHMLDLFDKNDNRIANPTGQEATSLIRMDGSFYFANGNIGGRTDGSGWLAGDNITWDASGAITFGNGIHIDLGSGNSTTLGGLNSKLSGVETTVGSVLTLVNALSNILVPVNASGTRVAWDSADLWAVKSVKGFYSEEFVSARGMNSNGGSIGATTLGMLDDVNLTTPVSGQALVYNGTKWVNQTIKTGLDESALASYLTTNNYAKKSDIPSLTGYATQAWVESKGYLTSHQSLANYVTLNTEQTIAARKTFSFAIVSSLDTQNSWWIGTAVRGKFIATNGGSTGGWSPVIGFKTVTGKYEIGSLNDTGYICYYHDTRTTNGVDFRLTIPKANGTLATQEWVQDKGYLTSHQTIYALTLQTGAFTAATYNPKTAALTVNIPTTTSHISEGTNLYFTNARATAALKTITDGLQANIDKKLDTTTFNTFKALFDSMFVKETDSSSPDGYRIKAKYGLYTEYYLSARGVNPNGGSSGASYLTDLLDVGISAPASGQALVYNGSKWVNQAIQTGLDTTQLANYLTTNKYATQSWVESKGYALASSLSSYVKKSGDTMTGVLTLSSGSSSAIDKTALSFIQAGTTTEHSRIGTNSDGDLGIYAKRTIYIRPNITFGTASTNGLIIASSALTYNGNTVLTSSNTKISGGVITINGTSITPLTSHQSLANYVTLNSAQTINSTKTFVGSQNLRMSVDTSNAIGINWKKTDGTTTIASIYYHNTNQNLILNPIGSSDTWSDAVGKYSLFVGNNKLTYNTYPILHTGNYAGTLDTRYVKKSGDTMTGVLTLKGSMYEDAYNGALNMANSDIYGLNSFYTADLADSSAEGMHFYRDATHVDTIWVSNGVMRFVPNRALGNSAAGNVIWHAGNDGSGSGLDADLLDGVQGNYYFKRQGRLGAYNIDTLTEFASRDIQPSSEETISGTKPFNSWGTLLTFKSLTDNGGIQIAGGNNRMYFRSAYNASFANSGWNNVAFLSDLTWGNVTGKPTNFVTTDTAQTITAAKTFTSYLFFRWGSATKGLYFSGDSNGTLNLSAHENNTFTANAFIFNYNGALTANSFVKRNGTSSQFLKADGSVDATSYARLSSANATVGASNLPVYLNAGTVTAVSSVGEAFLSWGGQNYSGNFGPLDAAITPRLGANRLAFANPNGTTFQYSTDGGASWLDYGLTATQKRGFFDGAVGTTLTAGKAAAGAMTTNHQLRVIINTGSAQIYTVLNKFIINVSTNGVSGLTVTIERALQSTPTSFVTAASNIPLSGWSGFNVINVAAFTTYGNVTTSQYGVIRFTFKCTGAGTNKNPFYIYSIMGFGGMGWTTPSNMALSGHLYSYDGDQNAVFPAKVTATSFAGSLSGNASSATQLQTARTLWGQSFNGTGNVSGSLSSVGNITGSGAIVMTANGRFTLNAAATSLDLKFANDDTKSVILNGSAFKPFDAATHKLTLGSSTAVWERIYGRYIDTDSGYDLRFCAAGTQYMHIVAASGNVGIGTTSPSRKLHVNGDIQTSSIYASNWLRTTGNTGWYSESYGGGWYMQGSTYIENYGSKRIKISGISDYYAIWLSSGGFCTEGYAGTTWNNGYGALNIGIANNSNQTPLLVAYRNGGTTSGGGHTGASRIFALELLNSGTTLRYCFGGAYKFEMSNGGVFHAVGGIYSDSYVSARGQNTSSDERLKNILRPLSLNVRDIANAPSVEFIWRKDGIKDVGSIAQYWKKLIPQLAPDMPDGSMGLQYGKTALMSVIAVARKTVSLEERVAQLERENSELKSQISQLKTQLA